jgi:zinc-ribbon domain
LSGEDPPAIAGGTDPYLKSSASPQTFLEFNGGVVEAVTRCPHCGEEIEEGAGFCPHCGKQVAENAEGPRGQVDAASAAPPRVVTAPSFGRPVEESSGSRRVIFIAVGVVAALLVAGLAYLVTRPSARPGEERLAGAVRPGEPGFPVGNQLMVEFDPNEDATIGANALGNYVVTLKPTVRNFTGRTVTGLEFHAAGLDLKGRVIREKTFARDLEIEPNKVSTPALGLNFPSDNQPAQLKLELTGVRFQ